MGPAPTTVSPEIYGRLPEPPRVRLRALAYRLALVTAAAGLAALEHGFHEPPLAVQAIHILQVLALAAFAGDLLWRRRTGRYAMPGAEPNWGDAALLVGAAVGALANYVLAIELGWRLVEAAAIALFAVELWRTNVALAQRLRQPGLLLPASFFLLIVIGTLLIKTPVAVAPGHTLTWTDAIFTMTSAVCVTGLTVVSTADTFSPFGQTIIAVFIQLGGLGIIIFGSVLALFFGRALSLRDDVSLSQVLHNQPLYDITRFVRFIVIATLVIEAIGALLMLPLWHGPDGEPLPFQRRLGMSLFHSVSAFCNAGFDITGESMEPFRFEAVAHLVIIPLVVLGSTGYPVLHNLYGVARTRMQQWWHQARPVIRPGAVIHRVVELDRHRISLHTKIVLATSLIVYLGGLIVLAAGQLLPHIHSGLTHGVSAEAPAIEGLSWTLVWHTIADASFLSLSSRTAGFNSMPMEELSMSGRFTTMALMLIGGSPGGTAGGVKTTVVALLVLSVIATLRARRETEAFGRTISDTLVRRAATLGICYLAWLTLITILLTITEGDRHTFEVILFDAVSATAVTGLSLGLTDDITAFGKYVVVVTMFLGRIGPLTLLGALMLRRRRGRPYSYAHEDVVLG